MILSVDINILLTYIFVVKRPFLKLKLQHAFFLFSIFVDKTSFFKVEEQQSSSLLPCLIFKNDIWR